ncbi:hypothetical protein CH063_04989 [Colletotrichum higginsianum]|uniref:Uncharacterized protein n=1 Tax=Colletotrichum higginsianum (strain IMI 349063) TaxID=759273 RepID=H1UXD8_COLHI|nr:hypothetical protein CH063_04989 [Colletotrichum higginsianum]
MPSSGKHPDLRPAMTSVGTLMVSMASRWSYRVWSANSLASHVWSHSALMPVKKSSSRLLVSGETSSSGLGFARYPRQPSTRSTWAAAGSSIQNRCAASMVRSS